MCVLGRLCDVLYVYDFDGWDVRSVCESMGCHSCLGTFLGECWSLAWISSGFLRIIFAARFGGVVNIILGRRGTVSIN